MIELSKRLSAIAHLVDPEQCVADVGCDHGYISIWLVENEVAQHVLAMDVKKGPLEIAKKNIALYQLEDHITIRRSDGLSQMNGGEAGGVVIAGMGGSLMIRILQNDRDKLTSLHQLVLQPQSEVAQVRKYLREIGFVITREQMVFEEGKYYSMFQAIPGPTNTETDVIQNLYDNYGKENLLNRQPVLLEFLRKEAKINSDVILHLSEQRYRCEEAAQERIEVRIAELQKEKARIERAMSYYQ